MKRPSLFIIKDPAEGRKTNGSRMVSLIESIKHKNKLYVHFKRRPTLINETTYKRYKK
jgi:hypothetical protein